MGFKRVPLTEEQFQALNGLSEWNISEVPEEHWSKIPRLQRRDEIVAIMASGCAEEPRVLNEIEAIAGMDVLVVEPVPQSGEKEGNAYHYVFTQTNHTMYPYLMYGPYKSETRVAHWFDATDLVTYWTPASTESPEDEEERKE